VTPWTSSRATFLDAGHILGSAITLLDISENGRRHCLAFSGDLGHRNQPILRAPEIPEGVDTLIMESTYGDRLHEPVEEGNQASHPAPGLPP
jgi:metallo-beta-lactamase family protein